MFLGRCHLILAFLALVGCDGPIDPSPGGIGPGEVSPGGDIDEILEAEVHRDQRGVKFRRDLPFPAKLQVRMIQVMKYSNVRVVETSALGKSSSTLNHKSETEVLCNKSHGLFGLTLEKAERRVVLEDDDEAQVLDIDKSRASELEGQSLLFGLSKGGWKARHEAGALDFKKAVWADSIEEGIPQLLVETAAHPRAQWFSSSRSWMAGDEITLTGHALKILDPYDVSGRVTLQFVGEEAIGGHPCGVFEITGNIRVKDRLQMDGSLFDSDISVTAGKIWASLLYPVVLREEYETVQTMTRRESKRGGPETKLQGAIDVKKSRNWVPKSS